MTIPLPTEFALNGVDVLFQGEFIYGNFLALSLFAAYKGALHVVLLEKEKNIQNRLRRHFSLTLTQIWSWSLNLTLFSEHLTVLAVLYKRGFVSHASRLLMGYSSQCSFRLHTSL